MTVVSNTGEFEQLTRAEIKTRIENALKANLDDPDLGDGSIYDATATAYAEVLASEQEPALDAVFDASFLESAEGENLENLVKLVGVKRRSAIHATGTVTFSHDTPVGQDYTIPTGTTVETTNGAVSFDTTEPVELSFYDGYESASPLDNYSGGTEQFTRSTSNPRTGSAHLSSTGGGDIKLDGSKSSVGKTHTLFVYFDSANSGTAGNYARLRYLTNSGDTADADFVELNENTGTLSIRHEVDGQIASTSVTVPSDEYLRLDVTPRSDLTHEAVLYDSGGNQLASTAGTVTEQTRFDGEVGVGAGRSGIDFDDLTSTAVSANMRAVNGGVHGNVAANTVTIMPSTVGGVDSVTNRYPTGDISYDDTDGTRFVNGQNRETDEELRERVLNQRDGEKATIEALISNTLDVQGVTSVTLFENDTDTDNTGSGGLPPVSFELVINGGEDTDVAQEIYETKAATSRDYGGANGTADSGQAVAVNEQVFTINFSRPTAVTVDVSLDLVHDDTYAGDTRVREVIIDYIGGMGVSGGDVDGELGVGDDVIINQLESRVMDVQGVVGVDSSDTSYTPSTTADANGLEVIAIGSNEVAQTDGTDGSISITKTQI